MQGIPRIGALVTHRNIGPDDVYKVLYVDLDYPDVSVRIAHVRGPNKSYMRNHPTWRAGNENLTYAEPLALLLPLGA